MRVVYTVSGQPGRSDEIATITPSAVFSSTQESICNDMRSQDDQGNRLNVNPQPLRKTRKTRLWKLSGGIF